jgi:hypothetical protein
MDSDGRAAASFQLGQKGSLSYTLEQSILVVELVEHLYELDVVSSAFDALFFKDKN